MQSWPSSWPRTMLCCGCAVRSKLMPGSRAATLLLVWLVHVGTNSVALALRVHAGTSRVPPHLRCASGMRHAACCRTRRPHCRRPGTAGHSRTAGLSQGASLSTCSRLQQRAPDSGNSRQLVLHPCFTPQMRTLPLKQHVCCVCLHLQCPQAPGTAC